MLWVILWSFSVLLKRQMSNSSKSSSLLHTSTNPCLALVIHRSLRRISSQSTSTTSARLHFRWCSLSFQSSSTVNHLCKSRTQKNHCIQRFNKLQKSNSKWACWNKILMNLQTNISLFPNNRWSLHKNHPNISITGVIIHRCSIRSRCFNRCATPLSSDCISISLTLSQPQEFLYRTRQRIWKKTLKFERSYKSLHCNNSR